MPVHPSSSCSKASQNHKKTMGCDASVAVGDLVYQDVAQDNFVITAATNDSPTPVIGIVCAKPTTTTASVLLQGSYQATVDEGTIFVSLTGEIQQGTPASGRWQRLGFSCGDGNIWFNPEMTRIRGC